MKNINYSRILIFKEFMHFAKCRWVLTMSITLLLQILVNLPSISQCASPPTATVTGLDFSQVSEDSIRLNMYLPPVGGADGYQIKVNTIPSFEVPKDSSALPTYSPLYTSGEQIVFTGPSENGVIVSGLTPHTNYFFKVFAYNHCTVQDSFFYEQTGATSMQKTKQIPEITFANAVLDTIFKTYGDPDFDLMAISDSEGEISYSFVGQDNGSTIISNTVSLGNADTLIVRASIVAKDDFISGHKDVTLAIEKAILTAKADDLCTYLNAPEPEYTISYQGFKNADDIDNIDVLPYATPPFTSISQIGIYPINVSGGNDNNYNFNYISGTLAIVNEPSISLPNNGLISNESAPQGALRYQRQLYLITPEEMAQSDLVKDSLINTIGFTIAEAQDIQTKGKLNVYLQNTQDTVSRSDTAWINISTSSASFDTVGLLSGTYEWQIRTVCSDDKFSEYSVPVDFTLVDTIDCNHPINVNIDNITRVSAEAHWNHPSTSGFTQYLIRITEASSIDWDTFYTTATSFSLNGLSPGVSYQVLVQSICGSNNSSESGNSFETINTDDCEEPSNLLVGTLTDSSVVLKWDTAMAANYYEVEYRRLGTQSWLSATSLADSIIIKNLDSGLSYEWRMITICEQGRGAYVNGTSFMTLGILTKCHLPEDIISNVKNDTSVSFSWSQVPEADAYDLRFRLKNSITWSNAVTPMTLVLSDSITIPNRVGPFRIPFKGDNIDSVYFDGKGMYVAFEYSNADGPLSSPNSALATSVNYNIKSADGADSVNHILSLSALSDISSTEHKRVLVENDLRPETFLDQ